ncbi:uncharacterized protein (UPF0548 family) [Actinocorallia herbida]|uniref:Uncharacterized protein (UPF0548 family) n=1 Tax=Actinocorallia herbida TaxID=58109 RepID=A0A3N1CQK9_9ACTN|nr:DUF1990 domain-containing protein [Actinocorallia herbida]ROO83583.1 uncharacterized protein (UPF0548 family) [Actinocorallia herbida]
MTFTYAEVGATRAERPPSGYSHLYVRRKIGRGAQAHRTAGEALMTFAMHRRIPVGVAAEAPRAAEGVAVTVTLAGFVKAPCRIVWTVEDARRTGWAYGTLPGHPECGEESFVVEHHDDDTVTLTVTAFSRAALPLLRPFQPLIPPLQRLYALRCAGVLRGIVRP